MSIASVKSGSKLTEFSIEVLGPLKVLHQAQAMSLLVAPDTRVTRAIPKGTERVLPVPVRAVVVALEHIPAREADDREAGFVQSFREIDSETILTALVGRWEEADEVEIEVAIRGAL